MTIKQHNMDKKKLVHDFNEDEIDTALEVIRETIPQALMVVKLSKMSGLPTQVWWAMNQDEVTGGVVKHPHLIDTLEEIFTRMEDHGVYDAIDLDDKLMEELALKVLSDDYLTDLVYRICINVRKDLTKLNLLDKINPN